VEGVTVHHVDVLVVIATIAPRADMLKRAMESVRGEDVSYLFSVQLDYDKSGPAVARNRAVKEAERLGITSDFLAVLDDDDMFKPGHLTKCIEHAEATGADVVYPWFDLIRLGKDRNDWAFLLIDGKDAFGQEFNEPALRQNNYIPVTALVRRSLFEQVGGFPVPGSEEWPHVQNEDWGLWLRLLDAGAKFSHLPERTWTWFHHGANTSGRSDIAAKMYP
jgi:glycosyltransferase involved in cell wall biosynthesis